MVNEKYLETLTTKQLEEIARLLGVILEKRSQQLFKEVNQANFYKILEN